jgi:uncharacterized protein with FMN-binding domain
MKRGLLIGVGTLGGLGAVFAITPPQFGSSSSLGAGGIPSSTTASTTSSPTTQTAPAQTQAASTPAPVATKATASKKKKTTTAAKSTAANSANTTATQSNTTQSTPTPAATKAPATTSSSGVSGTFAGSTSQTRFGPVQVQITVVNGKITSAKALQYPNGDYRSADISSQAIPYLVSQTLAAQSANISGVGGASYTSYGWYQSLQSALAKAGMQ